MGTGELCSSSWVSRGDVGEKDVPRCLGLLGGEIFGVRKRMAFGLCGPTASLSITPKASPTKTSITQKAAPPGLSIAPHKHPRGAPHKHSPKKLSQELLTPGCSGMAVGNKSPKAKTLNFLNIPAVPEVPQYPSGASWGLLTCLSCPHSSPLGHGAPGGQRCPRHLAWLGQKLLVSTESGLLCPGFPSWQSAG